MKLLPVLTLLVTAGLLRGGVLTIDPTHPVAPVSPRLYGLMTEEINYSYDGGLYAELVRNRAFLDQADTPVHWAVVQGTGSEASIALDQTQPLTPQLSVSLRLDVKKLAAGQSTGVANDGYWGIPVRPHTQYRASCYVRTVDYSGHLTLSLESEDGKTVYATRQVEGPTKNWQQVQATLNTGDLVPTDKARYVLRLDRPGTVWFSLVSLFPPTWNDRPNGLRKDLMQMLVDLKPKFLRFPGGNYLEGNKISERFDWKKTIGPLTQRPGHPCPWGYRSTDGMGLLEFLQWTEDMGAEPVLAVYAGYSLGGEYVKAGPDLAPYVQDALDEIEYVTGDAATTKWGAQRARDGHPAPFPLHYVEIGNEDGFDKSLTYDARFTQIFDAIKAKYPGLKCIATITNRDPVEKRVHSRQPDVLDEHFYDPAEQFIKKGRGLYENYDRKGPEIFVGEWAAYDTAFPPWDKRSANEPPTPSLKSAVADAAFMTEMERNSDVVVMHCYAPLFVNVNPGGRQWRPDMIGYNALQSYGSPSYHALKMFSTHVGDQILKVDLKDTDVLASATRANASGEIYLKLVNPKPTAEAVTIDFAGGAKIASTAEVVSLAAASDTATNSIDAPTAVMPATTTVSDVHSGFSYAVPANGVVVLTLKAE